MAKSVMKQLTELLRDDGPANFSDMRDELESVRQRFQTNVEHENHMRGSNLLSDGSERRTSEETSRGNAAGATLGDQHDDGDDNYDDGSCSSDSSGDSESTSGGSTSSSSSDSELSSGAGADHGAS